jgi:preprotein translocase subunit SecF
MIIGIFVGTYSSMFVASPLIILYHDWSQARGRGRAPAKSPS